MSTALTTHRSTPAASVTTSYYVTVRVAGQLLGMSVEYIEDVLNPIPVTPIPLSPPEVAGALNLRGRVVTAIDLRRKLGLTPLENPSAHMSAVANWQGHLYSFLIDEVGDVMQLSSNQIEKSPPHLDAHWRNIASGVYKLDKELMIIVNVPTLLHN